MGYLFGPVHSKRLGRSLGIDLIPHKICNYDCLYCECGPTRAKLTERRHFVRLDRLVHELDDYLLIHGEEGFDVVTLTGSGETTLEKGLDQVIRAVRQRVSKPVAVLTNGSLMHDDGVQNALALADIVLPSLDAASPEVFQRIDQPDSHVSLENIIAGMIEFRRRFPHVEFWLEILIVADLNDAKEELERLKGVISRIEPHEIHVSTVSRPPAYAQAHAVSPARLLEIQTALSVPGARKSSSLSHEAGRVLEPKKEASEDDAEMILATVQRRPSALEDLAFVSGTDKENLLFQLERLIAEGRIKKIRYGERDFFMRVSSRGTSLHFS